MIARCRPGRDGKARNPAAFSLAGNAETPTIPRAEFQIGISQVSLSAYPLLYAIGDPEGIGDDRQCRIHRANRGKEARIGDVQVIEFVRLARQAGTARFGTDPASSVLDLT